MNNPPRLTRSHPVFGCFFLAGLGWFRVRSGLVQDWFRVSSGLLAGFPVIGCTAADDMGGCLTQTCVSDMGCFPLCSRVFED